MVILKKPKSDKGVKGQLRQLVRELGVEVLRGTKETGKEVVMGFTRLPGELLMGAQNIDKGKNNWENEWLKDKDKEKNRTPISEKTGEHSNINPEGIQQKSDQAQIEQLQRRLSSTLNQQFTKPSSTSEYGQEQAKKYQEEHKPIYEKIWGEREEAQRAQAQRAQQSQGANLAATGSKRKAGDWRHGAKRKGPSPQDLNRSEFAGKGKQ